VDATADTLYEAAVCGLKLLRENAWIEEKPGPEHNWKS
jgi:hypothetical protein